MKIIVGLGNPEKEYKNTRHNIGFEVINKLSKDCNIEINKAKYKAHLGEGVISNERVIILKPQTYMNLSGESIADILNFLKLTSKDIIIVYDDVSLPVGDIKIREKGSAGGHNGIKSIISRLGTDEFLRIKVGVGEKPKNYDLADYVLGKFSKEEESKMQFSIEDASTAIGIILKDGVSTAMNKYNNKNRSEN